MEWPESELHCLTRKNMEINLLLSEVQSRLGLKLECDCLASEIYKKINVLLCRLGSCKLLE